jgi:hypothetical protein
VLYQNEPFVVPGQSRWETIGGTAKGFFIGEKTMGINRAFKGVWIPKEIWLADLTLTEKVFLTEINSLDNDSGCFASNAHFSEFFQLSNSRCSEIITSLKDKGYLSCEYIIDGKEVKKRTLRVFGIPKGGIRNPEGGYSEKAKGSNTKDSNTEKRRKPFIPPSLEEIKQYNDEKQLGIDCVKFYDYFVTGNWIDSKGNKVKNWKQKMITWSSHNGNKNINKTKTVEDIYGGQQDTRR